MRPPPPNKRMQLAAAQVAPRQIGIDAALPDTSPALLTYLRIFGGPVVGMQY